MLSRPACPKSYTTPWRGSRTSAFENLTSILHDLTSSTTSRASCRRNYSTPSRTSSYAQSRMCAPLLTPCWRPVWPVVCSMTKLQQGKNMVSMSHDYPARTDSGTTADTLVRWLHTATDSMLVLEYKRPGYVNDARSDYLGSVDMAWTKSTSQVRHYMMEYSCTRQVIPRIKSS